MIEVGQRLPEVLGLDQDGKEVRLDDFKGKKLVLYIYPRDMTPGCTNEACNLRDNFQRFLDKGYAVSPTWIRSSSPSLACMVRKRCMARRRWAPSAPRSSQMRMASSPRFSSLSRLKSKSTPRRFWELSRESSHYVTAYTTMHNPAQPYTTMHNPAQPCTTLHTLIAPARPCAGQHDTIRTQGHSAFNINEQKDILFT